MKNLKQLYRHDPAGGVYGDCQRTVIACLLDCDNPEDVPHANEARGGDSEAFWRPLDAFTEARGLRRLKMVFPGETPLADVLATMGHLNPGAYYTLCGRSGKFDCNHVVICCGGEVVWDPSPFDSGVVGPCIEDGLFWLEWFVPTSMMA